jgi:hypothetical protein
MRVPSYLSPSQLGLFESNLDEYYLQHLSEVRAPKTPQTNYMAIGSAYDAYVKASMFEVIFGKGSDPRFEFDQLFIDQVEEHNRDWAKENGLYIFESYKTSGAYDELLKMVQASDCEPNFETKISGTVDGIPLLGKPDLRFIYKGIHIIFDWKTNGYCSKSATSPAKNYRICRDGFTGEKPTKGTNESHRAYIPVNYKGIEIHNGYLEEINSDWADQLSIYSWILGEPIGTESVVFAIDQLVAKPKPDQKPLIRVASFRARISKLYQQILIGRVDDAWNRITTGHIFKELTKEENDEHCTILDQQAIAMHGCGDWFDVVSRKNLY